MFQVQKDKVKIQCFDYDLCKYLAVNCISLVYYLKNAYISGNIGFGVFFLHELHTNSPWIALQVCKGMFLMSLLFNVPALRELRFYNCSYKR